MDSEAIRLTLVDGRRLLIAKPTEASAAALLGYTKRVAGESDNLTFGVGEFEKTVREETEFLRAAEEGGNVTLAAFVNGDIVGFCNSSRGERPRTRHFAEFGITVRKDLWGHGIGKHLLAELLRRAATMGITKMNLKVRVDNARAIKLYESLGFVHEGRIKNAMCVRDEYVDEYVMGIVLGTHETAAPSG